MKITKRIDKFTPFDITVETHTEAVVLATVLANIGGNPNGPRGLADVIVNYLDNIGISFKNDIRGDIKLPDTFEEFEEME